jgi:hypothetical protein
MADLRRRIAATRFPDMETITNHSQALPLPTGQKLAHS